MSRVEGKMDSVARMKRELDNKTWWDRYWNDLCPTPEARELRMWALSFYGLSGVEQSLERLKKARAAIERKGYYVEEEDG